eukprot:TRINITY_DN961_c0_g1_i2.p1 TRINITY_DN961_c0_g1~~TRINITY_DN961_c0_g1_i2.p1  ORF type:complete len:271 (+),score=37.95 TRINITY_DN961_c0_g1_i2:48-860(+)
MRHPTDPALIRWLREAEVPLMFETMLRALLKEKPDDPVRFLAEFTESKYTPEEEEVPALVTQNVYVVRHGHRIDNFDDTWAATAARPYDPPLTEEGKATALALGKEFAEFGAEERPTLIISSPFTRCIETAIGVAKGLGLKEISVHKALGEIHDIQVLKHDTAPALETPTHMDGINISHLSSAAPPFPETRSSAMIRYSEAFDTIPDTKPCNMVLVTHGEAVARSITGLLPHLMVYDTPYCCYSVRQRSLLDGFWNVKMDTNGKIMWLED